MKTIRLLALLALSLAAGPVSAAAAPAKPPVAFTFAWPAPSLLHVDWTLEATEYEGESPWTLKLHDTFGLRVTPRGEELEIRLTDLARPEPVLWGQFPADFPAPVWKAIDGAYHGFIPGFRVSRTGDYLGLLEPDSVRHSFEPYHDEVFRAVPRGLEETVYWQRSVDTLLAPGTTNRGLERLWYQLVEQVAGAHLALGEKRTEETLVPTISPAIFLNVRREATFVRELACGTTSGGQACAEVRVRAMPTPESSSELAAAFRRAHGGDSRLPDPQVTYKAEMTLITRPADLVPMAFESRLQAETRFGAITALRQRWLQRFHFRLE